MAALRVMRISSTGKKSRRLIEAETGDGTHGIEVVVGTEGETREVMQEVKEDVGKIGSCCILIYTCIISGAKTQSQGFTDDHKVIL
jgi:hypothetical protein